MDLLSFLIVSKTQMKNFVCIICIHKLYPSMAVIKKVEEHVINNGGSVIRLGILYDESSNNLKFLKDLKTVSKYLPFIPNFSGNKKIYYITTPRNIENFYLILRRMY